MDDKRTKELELIASVYADMVEKLKVREAALQKIAEARVTPCDKYCSAFVDLKRIAQEALR
jgi:hypothetical protein